MKFSIRSILVLTMLVAAGLAVPLRYREYEARRNAACERLGSLGTLQTIVPRDRCIAAGAIFLKAPEFHLLTGDFSEMSLSEDSSEVRPGIRREVLSDLGEFPELRELTLPAGVTDRDVAELPRLPNLISLRLAQHQLSEAGWETIARACPNLETIEILGGRRLSVASVTLLALLPQLRRFTTDKQPLTDEHLQRLLAAKRLESLTAVQSRIAFEIPVKESEFRHLWKVVLVEAHVSDVGLKTIACLPAIEEIDVRRSPIKPSGVVAALRSRAGRGLSLAASIHARPVAEDLLEFPEIDFEWNDESLEIGVREEE